MEERFLDDNVVISEKILNMSSEERRKLITRLEEEARLERARINSGKTQANFN